MEFNILWSLKSKTILSRIWAMLSPLELDKGSFDLSSFLIMIYLPKYGLFTATTSTACMPKKFFGKRSGP